MAWCSKKPGHLTAGQSICFLTSPVRVKGGGYEAGMMLFALFLLCARRNEWTFCTFFLELPRDVDPPPLTYPRIGVQSTVHPFGLCISIRIPYFFCKKWIRELVIKSWHEAPCSCTEKSISHWLTGFVFVLNQWVLLLSLDKHWALIPRFNYKYSNNLLNIYENVLVAPNDSGGAFNCHIKPKY